MKKVIIELEDFNKIATYIQMQPVPFMNAAKAAEIGEILKRVKIAEVTEEIPKENGAI